MLRVITIILTLILFSIIILYFNNEADLNDDRNSYIEISSVLSDNKDTMFKKAIDKRNFKFPEDFYPKTDFRNEWWYFTGNLETRDGRQFGYQFTIFRNSLSKKQQSHNNWESNEIYMSHFAVTDIKNSKFYAFERLSRALKPLATFDSLKKKINVGNSYFLFNHNPIDKTTDFEIHAIDEDIELSLSLESQKPIILQGDSGLSQKSSTVGNASYYFSITRLKTKGTIKINGQEFDLGGYSWFDREWSTSSLDTNQIGWDWFSLQLDNNYEIMFYALRNKDGSIDEFSKGSIVNPEGKIEKIHFNQVQLKVKDFWLNPEGRKYPSGWFLNIPEKGINIEINPVIKNQEHRHSFRYWEGAVQLKGSFNNQNVLGKGYVELTGY